MLTSEELISHTRIWASNETCDASLNGEAYRSLFRQNLNSH